MIRIAIVVALVVASASARGEGIELPDTKARLELPDGWEPITAVPGLIAAFRSGAAVLAVTRANVPNTRAWKPASRQAYADEIERGIKASVDGYRRASKKLGTANGVPVLDVEARRGNGAHLIVRVLLFRTYALALAIELPAGSELTSARQIASRFAAPAER